ncbi:MAG: endonuclease/exonuclease/phosphatase family protein [Actinomycetes bacterium]
MIPRPTRLSMAVAACAVTSLVVSLGVVFSTTSGASRTPAADLVAATAFAPPRPTVQNAAIVDPAPPGAGLPPFQVEPPVVFEPKPEPRKESRRKARTKKDLPPPLPPAMTFTIGSYNVLGSSHTSRGGKWPGMAEGPTRIRWAVGLLNARGVDVVGFQELQRDQLRTFVGATGGGWGVYPGESAGPLGIENSLAWRRAEWTALELHTIQIPYFDGRLRPMPYVLLEHTLTGRKAWFANFHNSASNSRRGNNDGHRWRAMMLEIDLANRLWTETGYPVFVTGDMNEREVYFCNMTGRAPMIAANGGSNQGSCSPPPYPMPVDWIFGTGVVSFSNYTRADVPRISDHPLVAAEATLDLTDGVPRD